jgi:phenylpropionate dioxygenase-like ring-hydroxylating dioxygenase large terminal subunit
MVRLPQCFDCVINRRDPGPVGDGWLRCRPMESAPLLTGLDNTSACLARAWHAVALAADVGDAPLRVRLLGEPWVLTRFGGELTAFRDRCPHRLAPLSLGAVCGDTLQCRYHGWRFDSTGRCVEIPALGADATLPPRATLAVAAGVAERYGLVWLAPQEPVAPLPLFPEWNDDGFVNAMNDPRVTSAGALQLVDNFLDATHLPTVHVGTFGVADAPYVPPSNVERDGWMSTSTFEVLYRNHDDPLVETGEHPLVQPQELVKQICGPTTALVRLGFPLTGKTVTFLFACAPNSASSTTVFKLMARDDLDDPATQLPDLLKFEDRVLDEDLAVLEPYDSMTLAIDLGIEVHTRADRLSVTYRRLLAELAAAL